MAAISIEKIPIKIGCCCNTQIRGGISWSLLTCCWNCTCNVSGGEIQISNNSGHCLMFVIQMSPAFQLVNQKSGALSLRAASLSAEQQSSSLGYFPRTILKIDHGQTQSIRTIADYVTVSVRAYKNNSVEAMTRSWGRFYSSC